MYKEKLILTDIDGVVLNWEYAFNVWMHTQGHTLIEGFEQFYDMSNRYGIEKEETKALIRIFNQSAAIGFLPALRDATQYIKQLAFEGWQFTAITSLSNDEFAQRLRIQNLKKLFGDVFKEFIFLDCGADKDEVLERYEGSGLYWVEDKILNAEVGKELGLNSIIFEHAHNMVNENGIPRVASWQEIYEIVT